MTFLMSSTLEAPAGSGDSRWLLNTREFFFFFFLTEAEDGSKYSQHLPAAIQEGKKKKKKNQFQTHAVILC